MLRRDSASTHNALRSSTPEPVMTPNRNLLKVRLCALAASACTTFALLNGIDSLSNSPSLARGAATVQRAVELPRDGGVVPRTLPAVHTTAAGTMAHLGHDFESQ